MDPWIKLEDTATSDGTQFTNGLTNTVSSTKDKSKPKQKDLGVAAKRRCVSTACVACRRRKSKCDGNTPKCAACASVYLTECEYAPHTDHRRKGVYRKDSENLKTRDSTFQIIVQAILNYDEEDVPELVRQIRGCDNLEDLAESIIAKEHDLEDEDDPPDLLNDRNGHLSEAPQFETELSGKMGDLLLDGSVKFIGGTSNLLWLPHDSEYQETVQPPPSDLQIVRPREEAILSWTTVTQDKDVVLHFMNMYFCWHYSYFTTLSKELFYRDFLQGISSQYCSPLLVNVMLALGCHFSSLPCARADPEDSATTGDHFFQEAKRLLVENDELVNAKLCTVQALALMSVREAGCGRESKGWVYSGMSFRMAFDLGLNVDAPPMTDASKLKDEDIDARSITFWGCFLFDKCWSNYLGRQPQLMLSNSHAKKPDVFASEDSEMWSPFTDAGVVHAHVQPARTRAVALQILGLAEISSDLLTSFYNYNDKPIAKQTELKKLSDLHTRLEGWKRDLPAEMEPKDGQLPQVLLMHMFFQLLYIHLYRPFLRYTRSTSPLPAHISPRKFCTQAAASVSKLFRLYKRTHGLRQICNIAVYIAHSACTIHLLNIPDKNARRDIVHGVKHLEEIGEYWICARRTLRILNLCAEKWNIELPEEAAASFARTRARWGSTEPESSPLDQAVFDMPHDASQQQPVSNGEMPQINQCGQWSVHEGTAFPATMPQNFNSFDFSNSSMSTLETDGSTGGASLPSQSTPDLSSQNTRTSMPTQFQPAQQRHSSWTTQIINGRQYSTSARPNLTRSSVSREAVVAPTQDYGGVDGVVQNNQDWWLRDQNSLAMGFENWTGADWSSFGFPSTGNDGMSSNNNLNDFVYDPMDNFVSGDDGIGNAGAGISGAGFEAQPMVHGSFQGTLKRGSTDDFDGFAGNYY